MTTSQEVEKKFVFLGFFNPVFPSLTKWVGLVVLGFSIYSLAVHLRHFITLRQLLH